MLAGKPEFRVVTGNNLLRSTVVEDSGRVSKRI